jgi:hypothetical protein
VLKFDIEDLFVKPFNDCKFRENQYTQSHPLFKDANERNFAVFYICSPV